VTPDGVEVAAAFAVVSVKVIGVGVAVRCAASGRRVRAPYLLSNLHARETSRAVGDDIQKRRSYDLESRLDTLLTWRRKRGKVLHTYPMFHFLEILDANHIAQRGQNCLNQWLTVYLSTAKGRRGKRVFK